MDGEIVDCAIIGVIAVAADDDGTGEVVAGI
jgi:hypothetical protein